MVAYLSFKRVSPYEKYYYCPRCQKWIEKTEALIYKGEYVFSNNAVFRSYSYPVCPKCLKRVRTTAHHRVKNLKEA